MIKKREISEKSARIKEERAITSFIKFQEALADTKLSPKKFMKLLENRLQLDNVKSFAELLYRKKLIYNVKRQLKFIPDEPRQTSFGVKIHMDIAFNKWADVFFSSGDNFDKKIQLSFIKHSFCAMYPEYTEEMNYSLLRALFHLYCRQKKIKFRSSAGTLPFESAAFFYFFR